MSNRSLGSLTLDVLARIGGFKQGMEQAERIAQSSSKSIQSSVQKNIGDGFRSANNSVQQFTGQLVSMAAAYTAIRTAISSADEWTNLNNRIKLVTNGAAEFEAAQSNIVNIARETRQSLSATAELYQRIATNQKELGLTGQEVAEVVSTISKTLVISGTAAAAAQGALVQLGQAFASGTLRGQELNSVLEQAPGLAKAIADGLGVPVGRLRELSQAGELSADAVIGALQKQASAVDKSFGEIDLTIGQALTNARTNLTVFIGELDQAAGTSAALAGAINSLSSNLPTLTTAFAAFATVKVAQNLGERATALARNRVELIASTKADLAAAQAAELSARANLLAAQADVKRAASIGGSVSISAQAATATLAHRQATIALAAAQTQAAAATGILSGAMKSALAFVGGPAGLLFLVGSTAASFLLFRDNTAAADRALIDFNGTADDSIAKFKELNRQQQAGEILRLTKELNSSYSDINQQVAQLSNTIAGLGSGVDIAGFSKTSAEIASQFRSGAISADEFSQKLADLRKSTVDGSGATESFTNILVSAESSLAASAREYDKNRSLLDEFGGAQRNAAVAVDGTTSALKDQEAQLKAGQTALTKYVSGLSEQVEKANISLIRKTKGEFAALQVEVGSAINAAGGLGALSPEQRSQINDFLESRRKQIEQEKEFDAAKSGSEPSRKREIEDGTRLIAQLKERIALFGAETESARVAYDLQNGELANISQARKDEANALAQQLDLLHEEEQARKDAADAAQEQYEIGLQQKASISEYLSDLEFEIELMKMSNAQRETAIALRRLGVEQGSEESKIITEQIAKTREQAAALSEQTEVMDSIRDAGKGFFIDLAEGSKSFKESFTDAIDTIRDRLIALAAEKLIEQIFGQQGTASSGNSGWVQAIGQIIGAAFGGGRATGGPVTSGRMYEVGENGRPELITNANGKQYLIPGNNGNVTPLSGTAGGSGASFNININVVEGSSTESQSGGADQSAKELVSMIKNVCTQWATEQSRSGGFFYNMRNGRTP